MNTEGTTLGRYTLEARIAQGGMAAVFLGRAVGPGGFSKKVVVKRILAEHASNPVFVEMFLTEARLAALLNHPNVVQVYDFGEDRGQYYLAMELIDGVSVRALQHRLRKLQQPFPPRLAAHLIAMACAGLQHAHQLRDESGAPLHLVHRDISPDNLLVSRSGVLKLVDFGVARVASVSSTKTSSGLMKGKLAYMAPEQVTGGELDHRADLYAAGVALYELVAGRRPHVAQNELELALTILERTPKPIREAAPGIDERLAAIIDCAMQKDREKRFKDAQAMQDALEDWLGSVKELTPALCALVSETAHEQGDLTAVHEKPAEPSTPSAPEEPATVPIPREPRLRRTGLVLAGVAICVAAVGGVVAGRELSARKEPGGQAPAVAVPVVPAPVEPTPPPAPEPVIAEAPAATAPAKRKPVAAAADGFLTLRTNPWCEVTIDGTPAGTTPLVKHKLPAGSHTLELANEKVGARAKLSIVIPAGQTVTKAQAFPLGQLQVTAPAGTKVFRGSELLGVAPMQPVTLVAGKHKLGFMDPKGQFVNRTASVPAGALGQLTLP